MRHFNQGKPVRDTENAMESIIYSMLIGRTNGYRNNADIQKSVTEQFQSDQQFDDFWEKKR